MEAALVPLSNTLPPQKLQPRKAGHKVNPPKLASHDEIVLNRHLFLDTLTKFHETLGTKFVAPTIGGKELDLHLLYVEVTARGGLEQVIKDRKWTDITAVFNFPNTTTSASFVLRKHYISLLHHYEQVYFFGVQDQQVCQPAPLRASSPVNLLANNGFAHGSSKQGNSGPKKKRERSVPAALDGDDPESFVGDTVTGKIDGKFEHGYLVTVTVGSQKLRGILYHRLLAGLGRQSANVPGFPRTGNYDAAGASKIRPRRRRRNEMKRRDPAHPKPNRSGYNFFFADQHMRLKAMHPDKDKEISKMIGDLWNKLTDEEKAVYQERGLKDKERYRREMQEYTERLKMQFQNQQIITTTD